MKKVLACMMVVLAMFAFGCSGRTADFGVVDMKKVEAEAPAVKSIKEEFDKKVKAAQEDLKKETEGKSAEEAQKLASDKRAQLQVAQSEAQTRLKSSLNAALAEVAKEKKLGAVLLKDVTLSGGVDVTEDVIKKMK